MEVVIEREGCDDALLYVEDTAGTVRDVLAQAKQALALEDARQWDVLLEGDVLARATPLDDLAPWCEPGAPLRIVLQFKGKYAARARLAALGVKHLKSKGAFRKAVAAGRWEVVRLLIDADPGEAAARDMRLALGEQLLVCALRLDAHPRLGPPDGAAAGGGGTPVPAAFRKDRSLLPQMEQRCLDLIHAGALVREPPAADDGDAEAAAPTAPTADNRDAARFAAARAASRSGGGPFSQTGSIVTKGCDTALHVACSKGLARVARELLAYGADTNAVNHWRETPLHTAARGGRVPMVAILLDYGASPRLRDGAFNTPLHWLAGYGAGGCAGLLARGAEVDAVNAVGDTPLHAAARAGQVDAVEVLLAHGADASVRGSGEATALHLAAACPCEAGRAAREDVCLRLLRHRAERGGRGGDAAAADGSGSSEHATADEAGRSPLHYAAASGLLRVCDVLTAPPVRENPLSPDGPPPACMMLYGAEESEEPPASTSTAHSLPLPDINAADDEGRTPLHLAAMAAQDWAWCDEAAAALPKEQTDIPPAVFDAVCVLLVSRGAAVGAVDADGNTALHYAARAGLARACVAILSTTRPPPVTASSSSPTVPPRRRDGGGDDGRNDVDDGTGVTRPGQYGYTPLHWGALSWLGAGGELEGHAPPPSATAPTAAVGGSATREAGGGGKPRGKDRDRGGSRGAQPGPAVGGVAPAGSELARLPGREDICAALIAAGAPTDPLADGGHTVLHFAAASLLPGACGALLEREGLKAVSAVDAKGNTPLHAAAQHKYDYGRRGGGRYDAVRDVLIEHAADPDAMNNAGDTARHIEHELDVRHGAA